MNKIFAANNRQKTILIILAVVFSVVIVVCMTLFALKNTVKNPSEAEATPTTIHPPAEQAKIDKKSAMDQESKGESQKALDSYKAALKQYQQAGDENGIRDMEVKIKFMESAIKRDTAAEKAAKKYGDKHKDAGLNKPE